MPLIDASGSTIALVNAAATGSPPATTYTYSPSGDPSVSGMANDWPFQYHSMEKEFTDPGSWYYTGGGQFYSPQLVRSLSETGQTSSSGPGGGPSGNAIALPSGSSGGLSGQSVLNDSQQALQVGTDVYFVTSGITLNEQPIGLTLAVIAGSVDFLVNFFEDIFGGSDNPPTPRQLLHGRHPLYWWILGIPPWLIPDESSAGDPPDNILLTQEEIIEPTMGDPPVVEPPLSEPPAGDPEESMSPDEEASSDKPEHSKNKRPSTQEKHQEGQRRKRIDRPGGEKGDKRRPYRQKSIFWWLNPGDNEV